MQYLYFTKRALFADPFQHKLRLLCRLLAHICSLTCFFFCPFLAYYLRFAPFSLSSLVAGSYFFKPKKQYLAPKAPLLSGCFSLFCHVFHGSKGGLFIQLLWMFMFFVSHLAAFYTAFCSILPCVQQQNALRLASKRTAFSDILHCVQHQNAILLAADSPKMGVNGGYLK